MIEQEPITNFRRPLSWWDELERIRDLARDIVRRDAIRVALLARALRATLEP